MDGDRSEAEVRALILVAPLLLDALLAAEYVASLEEPLMATLRATEGVSKEVRDEASTRMMAAQRIWWDLRGQALAAYRAAGGER